MKRVGIATLVFVYACGVSAAQKPPADWNAALALLDQTVKAEVDKADTPSYSVAVVSLRHPVHFISAGYGNLAAKTPVSEHTVYEIGSITKLFTGTMLMQLRDAGKVSLDDPLTKHLPEFSMTSRFTGEVQPTLRQLVTHTSGLPRSLPIYGENDAPGGSEADWLAALRQAEAALPPFTRFKYSNLGMGLAGYALARTAGMPWSDYVKQNILIPLGMTETGFMKQPAPAKMATGYVPVKPGTWQVAAKPMNFNALTEAAGSIRSTAADMTKFAAWQLNDADGRVLSALSRREMRLPLWLNSDWTVGNGVNWVLVRKNGDVIAEHAGGTTGFASMLCIDDKAGIGIVVLANGLADVQGLAHRLLTPLQEVAKTELAATAPAPPLPMPHEAVDFVGTYVHNNAMLPPVTVTLENGILTMRDFLWGTIELKPTDSPRSFLVPPGSPLDGETVAFENVAATMRLSIGHGSIVYQRLTVK
jgi:CubicO group peptidase (beta-lactamase class C family)